MSHSRLGTYLAMWRVPRPLGVVSVDYLRRPVAWPLSVHRGALVESRPAVPRLLWEPIQATRWARWTFWGAWRSVARVTSRLGDEYAESTRLPLNQQRARARRLAVLHGITASDAYAFDLLRQTAPVDWADHLFSPESGWNVAASSDPAAARRSVDLLGDKHATNDLLAGLGIAVVPSELTVDPIGVLGDRPEAYVKPRFGARAHDAFAVVRGGAAVSVIPSGADGPVDQPEDYLRRTVRGREFLVQPRLRTHSMLAGLVDPRDVVTLRVVTRDSGDGPHVFSRVLEIPTRSDGGGPAYAHLMVDAHGSVGGLARPRWRAEEEQAGISGVTLPGVDEVCESALRAHRALPGLFAAAWDVAFAQAGWLFLEGNTGFAVVVPQLVSGPILSVVESPTSSA